jgi:hypothetical protein
LVIGSDENPSVVLIGEAPLHDCEDPRCSAVSLLGCVPVIASVTHFMTGFVPFE